MHRARGKRSGNRRGGYDPHDLEGGSDPQDLEGGSDPQVLEVGFDSQDLQKTAEHDGVEDIIQDACNS